MARRAEKFTRTSKEIQRVKTLKRARSASKDPKSKPKQKERRVESKLLSILRNGYFVKFDLNTVGKANESRVKLWRAVVDQSLKDIIEHYLVLRNDGLYLDVRRWLDHDSDDVLSCCDFSSLNPVVVRETFNRIEQFCKDLRSKGVLLS